MVKSASSFTSRDIAEDVISMALEKNDALIREYLEGNDRQYLEVCFESSSAIGILVLNGETAAREATMVRVIITRDPSFSPGYRIVTGYPIVWRVGKGFPDARYFFACYYNQDFEEIFGGAEESLSSFISAESDKVKAAVKRDIELILQEGFTEETLDSLLTDLGCEYCPADGWPSSTAWLQHILSRLG